MKLTGPLIGLLIAAVAAYYWYQQQNAASSDGGSTDSIDTSGLDFSGTGYSDTGTTGDITISDAGLSLIKTSEAASGPVLHAYQDSGGVWTIGYGHTAGVNPGDSISASQAEAYLRQDVTNAEAAVKANVDVSQLTQNQYDALVSFFYNVKGAAQSTLVKLVNAGDFSGAASQFGLWIHAKGQVLGGLVARRAAEAALFAGVGG